MFDIGWPELLLVMVIALLVIGPKELPNAIRTVTTIVRKMRMAAREFQSGLDDIARESGLDDIKQQIDDIDYYDPGEALKSIAESDSDLLNLDDDPDMPSGNSILDPNSAYTPPADDEGEPDAKPSEPAATETAAEDAPEEAQPATGGKTT